MQGPISSREADAHFEYLRLLCTKCVEEFHGFCPFLVSNLKRQTREERSAVSTEQSTVVHFDSSAVRSEHSSYKIMASSCEKLDQLVKDYLLFRGFTGTMKLFDQELKADKDKGLRVS